MVLMMGSLVVNTYFMVQLCSFTANSSNIQKQIDDLTSQISDLKCQEANLQGQMQTQQNRAGSPRLVTRLGAKDVRASPYANHPWSGKIRFYISGEVWNVGQIPAYNSTLHVVLFQGANVANDTHVMLGTIKPGSFVDVSADVFYEGNALTSWNITPETL
jgi:hypothetical protein